MRARGATEGATDPVGGLRGATPVERLQAVKPFGPLRSRPCETLAREGPRSAHPSDTHLWRSGSSSLPPRVLVLFRLARLRLTRSPRPGTACSSPTLLYVGLRERGRSRLRGG